MDPSNAVGEDGSRVFSNMGKVIAAQEKAPQHTPTRLEGCVDAALRGAPAARRLLRPDEARGPRLFIGNARSVSCHDGPLFSGEC